jgi:hypothetical protein
MFASHATAMPGGIELDAGEAGRPAYLSNSVIVALMMLAMSA